jgi:hypothetical protein
MRPGESRRASWRTAGLDSVVVSAAVALGAFVAPGCTGSIGGAGDGNPSGGGEPGASTAGPGGNFGGASSGGNGSVPAGIASCKGALKYSPTRLVRLNDVQITNAIKTMVPGAVVPPIRTPGRAEGEFVSWADQFPVQDAFAAQLIDAAFNVAGQAVKNATTFAGCAPGQPEMACAESFVDRFVARAFRRPLAADERAAMLTLYGTGVANGAGFASGIEVVVAATLSAPSFLYRTELGADPAKPVGATVALTPREIAAWLSFTLNNAPPDDELWQSAVDGSLAQAATLQRQIDRLLAQPQTRESLARVLLSWVDVPAVLTTEKTQEELAGQVFDQAMRASLYDEGQRFVADILWNGGTVSDLFTSQKAFVDARTAKFYGVADPKDPAIGVQLPVVRSGLLARAGLIAAARYGENPEVFRGRLIRERVLCGHMAEPPPTVNVDAFNAQYAGLSTKQRIAVRAGQAACNACHIFMDTLGIAFDNFGALGQVVTSVNGSPPEPAGELTGTDVDGTFTDLAGLSGRLAKSKHALGCLVEQMMTQAVGRPMDLMTTGSADTCARDAITAAVDKDQGKDQGKLAQMFRALAMNPMFMNRVVGGRP